MFVPPSFKTDSVRLSFYCPNHASAIDLGSMFGTVFMTFSTTGFHDRRRQRRGNSVLILELSWILLRSSSARAKFFRCFPLQTIVFHLCAFHVVSMCLSRALMVAGTQSVAQYLAWRNLAGLGTIGRVVPMHRSRSSGWAWTTAVHPFIQTQSIPSVSSANSDDWRAHLATPRLIRIQYHAMVTVLQCQCTRDLDPLRRKRLERDQFELTSWILR